ncbi:uncharacterized protein LOC143918684 isoform X2 [Arctopsyche grandis]|uniref:uncharacterized protein LOC143918684 isoform X2 n=1 Tax=Arctopsyche grandis TaxID=121162 RepID=UPI00406DA0A9
MASLVADYSGSSAESSHSSNDSSATSTDEEETALPLPPKRKVEDNATKLPKPDFAISASKNSVFNNPFAEEENAKKAILEKHVKMVPTKDKVQMINGRKICWNHRKGRCRFGHMCTFAHDTDLHSSKEDKKTQSTSALAPSENSNDEPEVSTQGKHPPKRKRPGLGDNVAPSKKVLKQYKRQKSNKS